MTYGYMKSKKVVEKNHIPMINVIKTT